jgi:hypothetical protein
MMPKEGALKRIYLYTGKGEIKDRNTKSCFADFV